MWPALHWDVGLLLLLFDRVNSHPLQCPGHWIWGVHAVPKIKINTITIKRIALHGCWSVWLLWEATTTGCYDTSWLSGTLRCWKAGDDFRMAQNTVWGISIASNMPEGICLCTENKWLWGKAWYPRGSRLWWGGYDTTAYPCKKSQCFSRFRPCVFSHAPSLRISSRWEWSQCDWSCISKQYWISGDNDISTLHRQSIIVNS